MTDLGERTEVLQERLCQRFGVAPRDRRKQRHLQQFVVAQGTRVRAIKAFAMAVVTRLVCALVVGRVLA